eukprot:366568-Chlamydomonas_euryale.AAC.3
MAHRGNKQNPYASIMHSAWRAMHGASGQHAESSREHGACRVMHGAGRPTGIRAEGAQPEPSIHTSVGCAPDMAPMWSIVVDMTRANDGGTDGWPGWLVRARDTHAKLTVTMSRDAMVGARSIVTVRCSDCGEHGSWGRGGSGIGGAAEAAAAVTVVSEKERGPVGRLQRPRQSWEGRKTGIRCRGKFSRLRVLKRCRTQSRI